MTAASKRRVTLQTDMVTCGRNHVDLLVSIDGAGPVRCCGSWCTGACGLPAAVIAGPSEGHAPEYKLHSSMVAVCHVLQLWRVQWTGERYVVPSEHFDELSGVMWW